MSWRCRFSRSSTYRTKEWAILRRIDYALCMHRWIEPMIWVKLKSNLSSTTTVCWATMRKFCLWRLFRYEFDDDVFTIQTSKKSRNQKNGIYGKSFISTFIIAKPNFTHSIPQIYFLTLRGGPFFKFFRRCIPHMQSACHESKRAAIVTGHIYRHCCGRGLDTEPPLCRKLNSIEANL